MKVGAASLSVFADVVVVVMVKCSVVAAMTVNTTCPVSVTVVAAGVTVTVVLALAVSETWVIVMVGRAEMQEHAVARRGVAICENEASAEAVSQVLVVAEAERRSSVKGREM